MQKRYALYRGVRGILVSHPFVNPTMGAHGPERSGRYVGQKRRHLAEGEKMGEFVDLFEPTEEVVEVCADLTKAVKKGSLEQLSRPVLAENVAAARHALANARPADVADGAVGVGPGRKAKHGGNS